MLQARIQQQFFGAADLLNQVADILARPLEEATEAVVNCLTNGGKVLAAGLGADAGLAALLCGLLQHGHERERPPLPAFCLRPGLGLPAGAGIDPVDALVRQLQVLGAPGDLLVLLAGPVEAQVPLLPLAEAAREADMSLLLFTGVEPGPWIEHLVETDVWLPLAESRPAQVRQIHLVAVHALCDAIDLQLLGPAEGE